jgi:hypothetical protein
MPYPSELFIEETGTCVSDKPEDEFCEIYLKFLKKYAVSTGLVVVCEEMSSVRILQNLKDHANDYSMLVHKFVRKHRRSQHFDDIDLVGAHVSTTSHSFSEPALMNLIQKSISGEIGYLRFCLEDSPKMLIFSGNRYQRLNLSDDIKYRYMNMFSHNWPM